MDATRARRTRDRARQAWYARHRQRRFARFPGFPRAVPTECKATPSHRPTASPASTAARFGRPRAVAPCESCRPLPGPSSMARASTSSACSRRPTPPLLIGMAFQAGRTAEGRALSRLVIDGEGILGRWVCRACRFVLVKG